MKTVSANAEKWSFWVAGSLRKILQCSTIFWTQQCKAQKNQTTNFLLSILFNDWGVEPIVLKKANHFVSVKLGIVQLDIMNFLVWELNFDYCVALTRQRKRIFLTLINGWITQIIWVIQNFTVTGSFTVSYGLATPLKNWSTVSCRGNLPG